MWHRRVLKVELLRVCVKKPIMHLLPGILHTLETGEPRNEALMINNGGKLRKALGNGYHRRPRLVVESGTREANARMEVREHIRYSGSEIAGERHLGLATSRDGRLQHRSVEIRAN